MSRHFWVRVHRYAGLAMAGFLVVVGLTGSLLAFVSELEHFATPQLFTPSAGGARMDAGTLAERTAALAPEAQVDAVWMFASDVVKVNVSPRPDPATGIPRELAFDQLLLNPYTGEELGRRTWGAISQGLVLNLIPFIYKLHYSLALDMPGVWLLGIVALIWTVDCFVGFYLTLPAARTRTSASRSLWRRWQPAWLIKWRASPTRINFDLHRAGGLWLWAALLIFAWSSVYMNLWDTVYTQVTRLVFDFHEPWSDLSKLDEPLRHPGLDWRQAQQAGERLMNQAAAQHGFKIERQTMLHLDREYGVYVYGVRSSLDFQDSGGTTRVFIDANSGAQRLLLLPREQYAGNTVTSWLVALHMAKVFGLPYRIFVCVLGIALAIISATGVIIWLQKRRSARLRKHKALSAEPAEMDVFGEHPAAVASAEEGAE